MRWSAAVFLALCLGAALLSRAEVAPNTVRMWSPPSGALDVARFPVLSVAFEREISEAADVLRRSVRLLDHTGAEVRLRVRRSAGDPRVAIAYPEPGTRLEPGEDYFLEARSDPDAESSVRSRFRTGGMKSVLCLQRARSGGGLESSCPENYWREDPASGLEMCTLDGPSTDDANPCRCDVLGTRLPGAGVASLGGRLPLCVCSEERDLDAAGFAVVTEVEPAPGSARSTADLARPLSIALDSDVSDAGDYRLRIEDITDPASAKEVARLRPKYDPAARRFGAATRELEPERRYRVVLEWTGRKRARRPLLSGEPGRFSWTFHTLAGAREARPRGMLPSPQRAEIPFPTQLPRRPHLRVLFTAPLPAGLADLDGRALELRRHDRERAVERSVAFVDRDLDRVHVIAYEALDAGERYDVVCSAAFARALGDPDWCRAPLGRFLVQVDPPASSAELRTGERAALEAAAHERWLPVRPTVLDYAHGLRERYATDESGAPLSFRGHVMVVPAQERTPAARLRVEASSGCRTLSVRPLAVRGDAPRFIASRASCSADAACPEGFRCSACPEPGNAGCPAGQRRCAYDDARYQTALTDFCRALAEGAPGCSLDDALRCASGGSLYTKFSWGKNRMNARAQEGCPRGYRLSPTHNCVAAGALAIELAPGEHRARLHAYGADALHFEGERGEAAPGTPPVWIRGPERGAPAVLSTTVPLPGSGLELDAGRCLTNGNTYTCRDGAGTCGEASDFACTPQQPEGSSAESCRGELGFRWDAGLAACVADPDLPGSPFARSAGKQGAQRAAGERRAGKQSAQRAAGERRADGLRSRWIQRDEWGAGVHGLVWPQRTVGSGQVAARIAPRAGARFAELPVLKPYPTYESCDRALDPARCALDLCSAWSGFSPAQQLRAQLEGLREAPAPHLLLWTGFAVRPTDCSKLQTIQGRTRASAPSGPPIVFVKLPPGTTPADVRIEVGDPGAGESPDDPPLVLEGVSDWTLAGLVFEGLDAPLELRAVRNVHVASSQFSSAGLRASDPDGLRVSDSFFAHSLMLGAGLQRSLRVAVVGNVAVDYQAKTLRPGVDLRRIDAAQRPEICTSSDARCVRPSCSEDRDCRIPFAREQDGRALIGGDPRQSGDFPRCLRQPGQSIGSCSHGVVDQTLISDNVFLRTWGIQDGPVYRMRIQRNHFEDITVGKLLDVRFTGASHTALLDNRLFNVSEGVVLESLRLPDGRRVAEALAVEGNLIAKHVRGHIAQRNRDGLNHPGKLNGAAVSVYLTHAEDPASDLIRGLRIVDNRILHGTGARGFHDGRLCMVRFARARGVLVAHNTLIGDCPTPLALQEDSIGRDAQIAFEDNLILPSARAGYREELCRAREDPPILLPRAGRVTLARNATVERGVDGLPRGNLELEGDPWRTLLGEPLPEATIVDAELYQSRKVATEEDEAELYRAEPSYDPALLDDVLEPRAEHPACAAGDAPSCAPPRP